MSTCVVIPYSAAPGVCDRCGTVLKGRQRRWCGPRCEREYVQEHDWNMARYAARQRDGDKCTTCGVESRHWDHESRSVLGACLEVNHIDPRVGRGYGFGCHNHLVNLETLCHPCHVEVTNRQAAARREAAL